MIVVFPGQPKNAAWSLIWTFVKQDSILGQIIGDPKNMTVLRHDDGYNIVAIEKKILKKVIEKYLQNVNPLLAVIQKYDSITQYDQIELNEITKKINKLSISHELQVMIVCRDCTINSSKRIFVLVF